MSAHTISALLAGCLLIVLVLQDAFEVVVLNRPVRRRLRLMRLFFKAGWAIWRRVGLCVRAGPRRDALLGLFGPGGIVLLFGFWAACIILGFGLLQWGVQSPDGRAASSLWAFVRGSGDAFFTLNYSEVFSRRTATHVLVLVEAGTGFGFIALTITYLPVLDQHFTQRDAKIVTMAPRAGTPPTSTTLLLWHLRSGDADAVEGWLRSWEAWCAGLVESHSSYPMLAYYRSQHSNHSWLSSLAVVLDCCTLLLVGCEERLLRQAECTYTAALRVLTEVMQALVLEPATDWRSRMLTAETYDRVCRAIATSGYPFVYGKATEAAATALQAGYEPLLCRLSQHLLLALPAWLPEADLDDLARFGREAALARLAGVQGWAALPPDAPGPLQANGLQEVANSP